MSILIATDITLFFYIPNPESFPEVQGRNKLFIFFRFFNFFEEGHWTTSAFHKRAV